MNIHSKGPNHGRKKAIRNAEIEAHLRNNAVDATLEVQIATLNEKERKTTRKLQTQSRSLLESIQSVKLGRRQRNKSLPRNSMVRSRSGSLTSSIPRPRTCLADTFNVEQGNGVEVLKLPSIGTKSFDKNRSLRRLNSSALQRRRFSENDALVESLRRFNALRIDDSNNESSNQDDGPEILPVELPKSARLRGRSGSCFGRLISHAVPEQNDDIVIDTDPLEKTYSTINCAEENISGSHDNEISTQNLDKQLESKTNRLEQTDNRDSDIDAETCTGDVDDETKSEYEDDLAKIIPKIVISEHKNNLPSPPNDDRANSTKRSERSLLSANPRRRLYGTPSAQSDWSRNKPLREARKKNTSILPSTFAALSMSRRFSSPDPSEDAVRAQQRFLEKLNRRRRSEQNELAQKVQEFMKQYTLSNKELVDEEGDNEITE